MTENDRCGTAVSACVGPCGNRVGGLFNYFHSLGASWPPISQMPQASSSRLRVDHSPACQDRQPHQLLPLHIVAELQPSLRTRSRRNICETHIHRRRVVYYPLSLLYWAFHKV